MALGVLKQVRQAIEQLNPAEVREEADRRVEIRLLATSLEGFVEMEDFLAPRTVSPDRRTWMLDAIIRSDETGGDQPRDIDIYEEGLKRPREAFVFKPDKPQRMVTDILDSRPELSLALARTFLPFHKPVVDRIVFQVSKENAMFSIATALPDIAPGISLPWAIPEALSDTAVLSVNQVRMAFLLAAASNRSVGYSNQKTEIAGIIAGAFGWRALARELVGKIPLGGGIIPKAGIAFAATYAEGKSLERLYRVGYGFTEGERKHAYQDALEQGKQVAVNLYERMKGKDGGKGG